MLGPQDVGHRVVVRRRFGVRAGRTIYTDALGELAELTADHLTVNTERGPVRIALADVTRAKRVPPRPWTTRRGRRDTATPPPSTSPPDPTV